MKKFFLLTFLIAVLGIKQIHAQSWIRINQMGYLPAVNKTAVLLSKQDIAIKEFSLFDALTGKKVASFTDVESYSNYLSFASGFRLDFTEFTQTGAYYIKAGETQSPVFQIGNHVYDGAADFLLKYMRQQRCGYNPFLDDSCHTHDGYIIYQAGKDSVHIDVTGGWHDASDYLQYTATSANAVFQMLFAYQQNPQAFGDYFDKHGRKGSNGIPDILDEAKWGLDWLMKMNPDSGIMYNQIADDRDHQGFRLPTEDTISYGKGKERPVYFCTGEPQGVMKHKNRATGIASTAGKYASAFALGSRVLNDFYPEFSEKIRKKAIEAYQFGKANPGVCQTAPCRAPYFYEEDNWTDDMELAATQIAPFAYNRQFLDDAVKYGKGELVTPWMGADSARHYQWYPFLNVGHYFLSTSTNSRIRYEFQSYLKKGIENVAQRGKNNPFLIGVPFIWCSNNLVTAMATQCDLYYKTTGDSAYLEMQYALIDWLFGCNPWGTSMIVGLPENGDWPEDTHSALSHHYGWQPFGGLVDGPVYASIYNNLKGVHLSKADEYAAFQSNYVVYHDDYADYSTNEPTMDGTASLTYLLSSLETKGINAMNKENLTYSHGAIIRTDKTKKRIHLVFTGGSFADGYETIKKTLDKHNIKASFFFTGDFYRNPDFAELISELKKNGHYLGAHSDKHLLYASWEKRDSTLVTKKEFVQDIKDNYAEMAKFGIEKDDAPFYLPPYEWYNREIAEWCEEIGLILINFSPGTYSNQDWSHPELGKGYYSSDFIYDKILKYEEENGMNGFILLSHIGATPKRPDKFYLRLDDLITELKQRGYQFELLDMAEF